MKAITLRNLPEDLARKIEDEAINSKASLNATVIRLLQQALGAGSATRSGTKRDLSDLAGTWTKEEADEFDLFLEESRRIDMEMAKLEWERQDRTELAVKGQGNAK